MVSMNESVRLPPESAIPACIGSAYSIDATSSSASGRESVSSSESSTIATAVTLSSVSALMLKRLAATVEPASRLWSNSIVIVEPSPLADSAVGATSVLLVSGSENAGTWEPSVVANADIDGTV